MTDQQSSNSAAPASNDHAVEVPSQSRIEQLASSAAGKIDYAALVVADEARASSEPTLAEIVRSNLEHFEGFARAGAKQRTAVAWVADATDSDPASVRRTFLKFYGRWDAFSRGVKATAPSLYPAAKTEEPAPAPGPVVWE